MNSEEISQSYQSFDHSTTGNTYFDILNNIMIEHYLKNTVKHEYNNHHWDSKILAVVDRWSLFRSHLCYKISK
jgi:hypothetical protein